MRRAGWVRWVRWARWAGHAVGIAGVVVVAALLWPRSLGGATTLVVVRGDSMLPGASDGDLVVAREAAVYAPGDVVVFRVATGRAGRDAHVMHRVLSIGRDGTVVTKGDNRITADGLPTTIGDLVGTRRITVPAGGRVLWLLSRWWVLGAIGGAIVTVHLLGRDAGPRRRRAPEARSNVRA